MHPERPEGPSHRLQVAGSAAQKAALFKMPIVRQGFDADFTRPATGDWAWRLGPGAFHLKRHLTNGVKDGHGFIHACRTILKL